MTIKPQNLTELLIAMIMLTVLIIWIHDILKLYKHGYSRVTDHASREIRFNRLTRSEGLRLVKHYERKPLKYINQFSKWLGVDTRSLKFVFDRHRNPTYWRKIYPNKWIFNGNSKFINDDNKNESNGILFEDNSQLEYDKGSKYITFGKGYPT